MPRPARSTLWHDRDFLLLWGGQAVSQAGSQVTILALPLVAIVLLHATTLQVGLLSATATSAYLLVSLPAGVVADRVAKRTLMLASDAAQLVVIGSVPLAYAAGVLSLGQLYVVALATSVLDVFFLVAYTSYLPVLVAPEQLMDGNGKLATTQSLAQVAGPGLGALLVGRGGRGAGHGQRRPVVRGLGRLPAGHPAAGAEDRPGPGPWPRAGPGGIPGRGRRRAALRAARADPAPRAWPGTGRPTSS